MHVCNAHKYVVYLLHKEVVCYTKSRDPGIPTISCSIGKTDIHNALCDLGARVSVIPYSLYKRLGLGEYSPTTITL